MSEPPVPADLEEALDRDAEARGAFDALPPSHKQEYIRWVDEAKAADTRQRRIEKTLELLREQR